MSELIPIELQLSAVVLAQELSLCVAAEKLRISPSILRARMRELATRLECCLFQEKADRVEVTKDGQVLINAFRSFLAQNGRLQE
jgi:DNA-binding transcriptional LysR family regulator